MTTNLVVGQVDGFSTVILWWRYIIANTEYSKNKSNERLHDGGIFGKGGVERGGVGDEMGKARVGK